MNKYSKFLLAATISLTGLFTSCGDDFLERSPLVNINDASYWASPNDLKNYVNNLYNQNDLLPRYDDYRVVGPYTVDADEGSDTYIRLNYNTHLNGETVTPGSGGGWSIDNWWLLRDINYFMDHYHNVPASSWEESKKYVGEALFFRSIFYFTKLRRYGDLPWSSTTINVDSEVLFGKRLPRNQVVDSIMYDLDRAVEYLPARGTGAWTGRITKEVALVLQARIALFEGTWERYHAKKNTPFKVAGSDGTKFIQKAADTAGALMALADKNGYPALDNVGTDNAYWNLFNQKDYSGSKEVLAWRRYSAADGLFNRWGSYSATGAGGGITKRLVDAYLCIDGKPIANNPLYKGDETLVDLVTNRDPRLNQTIWINDSRHLIRDTIFFTAPSFTAANEQLSVTGYQLYKGHTTDNNEHIRGQFTTGAVYFRYAEALLIYAEAKAELGTITQSDIDNTINAIRARVGMPALNMNSIADDPNWEFAGISPLLQEIRRERKVEFACETLRMYDISRWAAADELIAGYRPQGSKKAQWLNRPNADPAYTAAVERIPTDKDGYIDPWYSISAMNEGFHFRTDRDYLYPLPTTELTMNPNLTQNPNW
jgi:hypothetical protein